MELSDILRVYIGPNNLEKIAEKLRRFVEAETKRYEGFKERYRSGVSEPERDNEKTRRRLKPLGERSVKK